MEKKLKKLALTTFALAGLFLLASVPDFFTKASSSSFWENTEDEITINKKVHDFGTISSKTDTVSATFTITNNTKVPIAIPYITSTCNCSRPEWEREPIPPGASGNIVTKFGSKNYHGPFDKSFIILTTGNPDRIVIRIKGIVK